MNSINLVGNICNDLQLRQTQTGKPVLQFNVAVKRPFTRDVTDFFTVVAWDKQAEVLSMYSKKGDKIGISGMLTSRKWEDANGNKRTAIEVVASNVVFMESKKENSPQMSSGFENFVQVDASEENLPF